MMRTYVVTGAASGIGAATARLLKKRGHNVITCDLHKADVIADLATPEGRNALVEGVARASKGRIDAIIANAGGGPPETCVQLNFFGALATLDGLRPLLKGSPAPRAVAVSSIASLRMPRTELVEACLALDEERALDAARTIAAEARRATTDGLPDSAQVPLDLYGNAKLALGHWCRRSAASSQWAGSGITLNVVALGFYDTPAAAYVLNDRAAREAMSGRIPLQGSFPGRAEDAGEILAWLTSAENTQITGQILYADGGVECLAMTKVGQ